ncbi:MAG: hypothetical protein HOP12_07140, partial [Candidatus Eisenbacteria bacterium]|nr:hypothetical protein [Candidatus Eisenbacteria bacterium]
MPKSTEKKARVYEIAKELGMSSEAVQQIARRMGVELKNHMSTLASEVVDKIRGEIAQGTAAVKEEQARKHEQELQRARDERAPGSCGGRGCGRCSRRASGARDAPRHPDDAVT